MYLVGMVIAFSITVFISPDDEEYPDLLPGVMVAMFWPLFGGAAIFFGFFYGIYLITKKVKRILLRQ